MLVLVTPLTAQTTFGRISGTVLDPSGAAIPAALVTITDTETHATRVVTTNGNGFYVAENLPIGPYSVGVVAPGFKRASRSGLQLVADGRVTADFKLEVGEATQTVDVVATKAEMLNTVSGEIAHVIDKEQVDNLALNGRTYIELLTLVPGAVVTNPDQFGVMTSLSATNQVVNGHRTNQNNLTVDGVGNLDDGANGSLINNVSPDFLQEVKIQTSNFSAEYGRSAGVAFNVVTKNGTNDFHGAAFEYFRNDALDARNFFSPQSPSSASTISATIVGGADQEEQAVLLCRARVEAAAPAGGARAAHASDHGRTGGQFRRDRPYIYEPGTKTPFPNNIIPASMITPDGRAIANVYKTVIPQACDLHQSRPSPTTPLSKCPTRSTIAKTWAASTIRINDKHTLFGRWIDDYNSIYLAFGPGGTLSRSRRRSATAPVRACYSRKPG